MKPKIVHEDGYDFRKAFLESRKREPLPVRPESDGWNYEWIITRKIKTSKREAWKAGLKKLQDGIL